MLKLIKVAEAAGAGNEVLQTALYGKRNSPYLKAWRDLGAVPALLDRCFRPKGSQRACI